MTLNHEIREQALVCRPEGDFDEAVEARISELAFAPETGAERTVVLDLGATAYLSSRGVAALLKLQADLGSRKRSLALAAPSSLVRRILYQAGIASAMPIHLTVEEACGKKA